LPDGARMPDPIELPRKLRVRGWKVKVYSRERLEPPHLTLICRERVWRISLRDRAFMVPPGAGWGAIAPQGRAIPEELWQILCDAWDEQQPTNPVSSEEEEDDGQDDQPKPCEAVAASVPVRPRGLDDAEGARWLCGLP